jgi:class 3 adenylate cyclase/TolB-like protein
MSETRKLVAILVADVVGYSRLAGTDEERTLARLRGLRSDLIDPAIAAHHGRIVKRTGDGSIIEFRSVVDAVRCAIEVQTGLIERNAGLPPERRIEFRVGIHVGDVVEESDGDLMGDGVNIAARLEGIARPGTICLSEDAYRQARDRVDAEFLDLGEQTLKNIARPVRAYAVTSAAMAASGAASTAIKTPKTRSVSALLTALAAVVVVALLAAGTYAWHSGIAMRLLGASAEDKLANAPRLSIVVLPFENLSGDKEQDYFADGITDDLTTDLSHLPDSFVISRGTAFTYKGKPIDAKQTGRDLGVRYLLEGSVRRIGETITVNAQLISTETGAHVWADRFEGNRTQLGELQVEVVARLARSLNVELVKAESLRSIREHPNNPEAVDLAMRGWAAYNKGLSPDNSNKAVALFDQALKLDAQSPEALVGRSMAQINLLYSTQSLDREAVLNGVEDAMNRVLASQPDLVWAHFVKGEASMARKQFDDAMAQYKAAIATDPNFAPAYGELGLIMIFLGRAQDAFELAEKALRLSPQDPLRFFWQYYICHAHAHLAQWEQSVEWCAISKSTNPSLWYSYVDLAAAYAWLGRETEAKVAAAELQKLNPGLTLQKWLNYPFSDNLQFKREYERIGEGLRKAGLPEGQASPN